MVIIIPDEIDGLKNVEGSIEKINFFNEKPYKVEFRVYLPRFKIESSIDITELLKQVN